MNLPVKFGLGGAAIGCLIVATEYFFHFGSSSLQLALWPSQILWMDYDPNAPIWDATLWGIAFISNALLYGVPSLLFGVLIRLFSRGREERIFVFKK